MDEQRLGDLERIPFGAVAQRQTFSANLAVFAVLTSLTDGQEDEEMDRWAMDRQTMGEATDRRMRLSVNVSKKDTRALGEK